MAISIIPYEDSFASDYIKIGLEWLERHDVLEDYDMVVLSNPRDVILNKGGYIFFAQDAETKELVGTISLAKNQDNSFEVMKMGVLQAHLRKGIGEALLKHAIAHARSVGAERIVLYSMSILEPALTLYRKCGFIPVEISGTKTYAMADIKMEQWL